MVFIYLADGNPNSWYQAVKSSQANLLNDFDDLVEDFCNHFGDSDLVSTAYHKIKMLRQTGSCASYASHFWELVVHLDWTDKSKIAAFKVGLKDQVHDLLIMVHPKPTTFNEYVKSALKLIMPFMRTSLANIKPSLVMHQNLLTALNPNRHPLPLNLGHLHLMLPHHSSCKGNPCKLMLPKPSGVPYLRQSMTTIMLMASVCIVEVST
jgi:Retrotransposon gag protein